MQPETSLEQEVQVGPIDPAASADPGSTRFSFGGSLRTRAAKGTIINTAFTAGLGALALLKSFVLAGFVSSADYGVWGILVITLSTVLWLKQVGIGDKYIQQDEADQERAFQTAFTLELMFTAALVVVLVLAVPVIVVVYHLPKLIAPSAVVALALFVSAFQSPQWIYYRRMDFARQRALSAVDPVVGFVTSVALAAAGAGYWAFVGGLAAGACASSAAAVVRSPIKLRLHYERGALKSYTSFSAPLLMASGASFVMVWAGFITTKLSLGIAAVGVITLAGNIQTFTDRADDLVTGALYPAICAVKDRTSLLHESFVKSNRLALMWAVPFGVALTLFSSDLVRFGIGERWRPAVIVLEVYGVLAAINHVGFNWTAYFRARGITRPIATANLAAMVVFLIGGIPLLLAFGLPGFAAGVALQGLAAFLLRAFYLQRLFPGFNFIKHMGRSFLPTLPAVAAVLLMRALEPHGRTVELAIGELCVYGLITAVATWYAESNLVHEALGVLRSGQPAPASP